MEKIVIETNMKKLPETCSKCRFKKDKDNTTFCTAPGNNIKLVKTYVKERYNYYSPFSLEYLHSTLNQSKVKL